MKEDISNIQMKPLHCSSLLQQYDLLIKKFVKGHLEDEVAS